MILWQVFAICLVSNFVWELLNRRHWRTATERTFFQGAALLTVGLWQ